MAATHTTNLNLNKPDRQDFVSVVTDINDNMDMIDTAIGNPSSASGVTGNNVYAKIGTLDSEKIDTSNIVDNLTTNDSSKPLSAAQGYTLNSNLTKSIKSVCPIAEGNTHSPFVAGMIVYIRNHPTLTEGSYTVTQYVAKDATLSDSNVTYNYYGGLDVLNSKVTAQAGTITFATNFDYAGTTDYTSAVYKSGDIVVLNLCFWCNGSFSSGDWANVCNISEGFRPKNARPIQVIVFGAGHTNGKAYDAKIATNGNINFYPSDITTISGRATINACWTV